MIPDVEVLTVAETVVRYDAYGQKVDLPVDEHARGILREICPTRQDFHDTWLDYDRRGELRARLERQGIHTAELTKTYGDGYATYDLLAHVGYGMRPVLRKDRTGKSTVQKILPTFSPLQRQVLEGLLVKFVDDGLEQLAEPVHLKLHPFDKLGTLVELIRGLGGREAFEEAISALEIYLYDDT